MHTVFKEHVRLSFAVSRAVNDIICEACGHTNVSVIAVHTHDLRKGTTHSM